MQPYCFGMIRDTFKTGFFSWLSHISTENHNFSKILLHAKRLKLKKQITAFLTALHRLAVTLIIHLNVFLPGKNSSDSFRSGLTAFFWNLQRFLTSVRAHVIPIGLLFLFCCFTLAQAWRHPWIILGRSLKMQYLHCFCHRASFIYWQKMCLSAHHAMDKSCTQSGTIALCT